MKPHQAVRAPGVFGDISAERADLLTRRVRRVVVPGRSDAACDLQVRDTRFHRHALIRNVDLEHAIQFRETDDHATRHRQRTAREPCPVATRHEGDAFLVANPHDRLHVSSRLRQKHELGQAAQVRERVALIGDQLHGVTRTASRPIARLNWSTSR